MAYTNSPLVAYTKLSPNHSGQRTHSIDRITPHCVVGQCTAEGLGDWFAKSSTQASSNYGIDKDGRVGLYVEEKNRSWCSSSRANDQRAVTIECASDTTDPYAMTGTVFDTLVTLCADICRRKDSDPKPLLDHGKHGVVIVDEELEIRRYPRRLKGLLSRVEIPLVQCDHRFRGEIGKLEFFPSC